MIANLTNTLSLLDLDNTLRTGNGFARGIGFEQGIATQLEVLPDGRLADCTCDGLDSDSINDLPLLLALGQSVMVDPDARLATEAQQRHWPVLRLVRALPRQATAPI